MAGIPDELRTPSFHVQDAYAAGIGRGALRRFDAPFRGVRMHPDARRDDGFARELSYAPRLAPWQFFSHETALALSGVPVPWRTAVHVSAHRPAREPRIDGIVGHRLQTREPAWHLELGVPTEHPVRAWRQCARLWTVDQLVYAADHLIHPDRGGFTTTDLLAEVELMGDVRRKLRAALDDARVGSESARETALRLAIVRNGLPEPTLNLDVFDSSGTFVARLDLAYRRFRVGIEYDGRQHAFDVAQFERDAERWRELERAGWHVVRILNRDLRGDGRRAVRLIADALIEAGWKLGAPVD